MGYLEALLEGAAEIGLSVTPELAARLAQHQALVVRWASKMNLTTVVDPEEAARLHGLDSLLIAELVDPADTSRAVDVGSGAGFPGLVVALARPALRMRLLEPARKRASFLRVALADLRRPDVTVEEGRLDSLPPGARPPWDADLILSRATIPPLELIPTAAPYLAPGGRLVLTSGAGAPPIEAIRAAAAAAGLIHLERVSRRLPRGESRVLDLLGPKSETR